MKKVYSTPHLTLHGDVERITQQGGTGNADLTIDANGNVTGTTAPNGDGNYNIDPAS